MIPEISAVVRQPLALHTEGPGLWQTSAPSKNHYLATPRTESAHLTARRLGFGFAI